MKRLIALAILFIAIGLRAQELKPTLSQALLKVVVIDDKNKPQGNLPVSFTSIKDGKEYTGSTNADGKFSILVPPGQKYKVKYTIFNVESAGDTLEIPSPSGPLSFTYTITAYQPKFFTLKNVFFDSGKSVF